MFPSATKDDTVHTLKNSAQNIKSEATDAAYDVKDDVRAAANRTGRKVREFLDTAKTEISHASDTVSHQIHDKPIQSTLVALGAGFLLGMLYRR